jgi:thioredoxin 1
MTSTLFIYLLIGVGAGATLGYFGSCKSGACPLTANWRRGAFYGAVMGLLFYFSSGGAVNSTAMNQSTDNVKHISEAEFDTEVAQATLPVVVDFYATWCGPCRQFAPTMDSLANQYAGKIKFVKVNVDESPTLAQKFQVEGIPMLVFLQNGKAAGTSVGVAAKEDLILRLNSLLPTNTQPAAKTPGF